MRMRDMKNIYTVRQSESTLPEYSAISIFRRINFEALDIVCHAVVSSPIRGLPLELAFLCFHVEVPSRAHLLPRFSIFVRRDGITRKLGTIEVVDCARIMKRDKQKNVMGNGCVYQDASELNMCIYTHSHVFIHSNIL